MNLATLFPTALNPFKCWYSLSAVSCMCVCHISNNNGYETAANYCSFQLSFKVNNFDKFFLSLQT